MKNEKLVYSWNKIDPDEAAQGRMLHNILTANKSRDVKNTMLKRYVPIVACIAVIIASAVALPNVLHNEALLPTPNTEITGTPNTPSASGTSGSQDTQIAVIPLTFNKTDLEVGAKIIIPLHFWHELTEPQLQAVFHSLGNDYTITATANYNGETVSLSKVDARFASLCTDEDVYIQIAPGKPSLCYVFDVETQTTDVYGTEVTAGIFEGNDASIYFASWTLDGVGYYVELSGGEAAKDEMTKIVSRLIYDGAADLSVLANPVVPELRDNRLSLNEAHSDTEFGAYLPRDIPAGFTFDNANRFVNQERDSLSAFWYEGLSYIEWRVSVITDTQKAKITAVADKENYDLSLYTIPYADSVPAELRQIVNNPIFRAEEMTLNVVKARAVYRDNDAGDEPGYHMNFGVLYGDVLVDLSVKGATPEAVWAMLESIGQ